MSHHSLEWDNPSVEPTGEEDRLGFMLTTQLVLYNSDDDDDDQSEEYVKIKKSTAKWVNSFLKAPGANLRAAHDVSDENDSEVSQHDDEYEDSEDEEEAFYKQLYKDIDEDMIHDFDSFIREPGETITTFISRLEERLDLYLMAKPWLKEDIKTVNVWNKFYSYVLNPELRELCIKKKYGPDQLSSAIQLAQNYHSTSTHPVWGNAPSKNKDESWASLTEKEISRNNNNKGPKQKAKSSCTINSDHKVNDCNDKSNKNTQKYTDITNIGKRGSTPTKQSQSTRDRKNYNTNNDNNQTTTPKVPNGFSNRLDFSGREEYQNRQRSRRGSAMANYPSSEGHEYGIHSRLSYSDTGINRHSPQGEYARSTKRGNSHHQYGFNRGNQRWAESATGHEWPEENRQQGSFQFEQRSHFRGTDDHWWAEDSMYPVPSGRGRNYNAQNRNRQMWGEEDLHRGQSNRGHRNNVRGRNRQAWYEEANLPDPLGYRYENNVRGRYGHIWGEERIQPGLTENRRGYNSQSLDGSKWSEEAMQPGLSEFEHRNNTQRRDRYKWTKEAAQSGPREYGYKNPMQNRDGRRWDGESRQHVPSEYRQMNNNRGRDSNGLAEWTMQLGPSERGPQNYNHGRNGYRRMEGDIQYDPSKHRHHNRSRGRGRGRGRGNGQVRGSTTDINITNSKRLCYWCKEENHKSSKCPVFDKVQEHILKKNHNSSFSEST